MALSLTEQQRVQLQSVLIAQSEVQGELERREWAEPNDNVMAEYITVLLANGNPRERVQTELDDLVGSDFDSGFLDWLFSVASSVTTTSTATSAAAAPRAPSPPASAAASASAARSASPVRNRRLIDSALAPLSSQNDAGKRKFESRDTANKRRISEGAVPEGPRAMTGEGRSLADRMGPRNNNNNNNNARGGMPIRGVAGQGQGPRQNNMGGGQQRGFQPGFRPNNMMQPGGGFPQFFAPGQQEMMAQMMMMQANMAQMGEMMHRLAEEKESAEAAIAAAATAASSSVRPVRPSAPVKLPHGTKLGSHSVSAIPPKITNAPAPIPDKPSSKALCKYSIGCSNARCIYSHPSPVADEKTGMVLSDEPCEKGRKCKDAECIKSHVSPAAVLGETAGPSRLLCKYLHCSNPTCAFRHEDENGNPIPPPALTAAKTAKDAAAAKLASAIAEAAATAGAGPSAGAPAGSSVNAGSDNEDGDVEVVMTSTGLMDGPLEEGKTGEKMCRYGERCTRPDCKFAHPASRPTPKSKYGKPTFNNSTYSIGTGGMNRSKKFGSAAGGKGLNPTAGEFKPKPEGEVV